MRSQPGEALGDTTIKTQENMMKIGSLPALLLTALLAACGGEFDEGEDAPPVDEGVETESSALPIIRSNGTTTSCTAYRCGKVHPWGVLCSITCTHPYIATCRQETCGPFGLVLVEAECGCTGSRYTP